MNLFTEPMDAGNSYRSDMLDQMNNLIQHEFKAAEKRRKQFFHVDYGSIHLYEDTTFGLRQDFMSMLGWPLGLPPEKSLPTARELPVAEDDLGKISRLWVKPFRCGNLRIVLHPARHWAFPLVRSMAVGDARAVLRFFLAQPITTI